MCVLSKMNETRESVDSVEQVVKGDEPELTEHGRILWCLYISICCVKSETHRKGDDLCPNYAMSKFTTLNSPQCGREGGVAVFT